MGSYLSQPVTTKESEAGSGGGIDWVASSMQGWRTGMEDAHIAITDLRCGRVPYTLLGVFDGHGGREVANYCKAHVPDFLQKQLDSIRTPEEEKALEVATIAEALVKTFNGMDDMLRRPESEEELLSYKKKRNGEGAEEGAASSSAPAAAPDVSAAQAGSAESSSSRRNLPPQMQMVQDRLQATVRADMARAQERGELTQQEAVRIAMTMSVLQRLEGGGSGGSGGNSDGCAFSAGCTAVCVVVTETHVICANAGDSRAVLCRGGKAVALSRDHKPNDRGERRRITAAGGTIKEIHAPGTNGRPGKIQYRVNGDLNLSRAIGDLRHKNRSDLRHEQQAICSTPDVHFEVREPDDEFVVLACDGVWDVRTNRQVCDEVREGLRAGRALQVIAESILDACISPDPKATQGLGADNMTIIIAKLLDGGMVAVASAPSPRKQGFCLPFRCLR